MEGKLKILMLEDVPSDAELVEHALRKGEVDFESRRVDTREAFTTALEEFRPDVALLDVKVPGYGGREALAQIRKTHPEIPAIMVTGTLGDEAAIELLKAGAANYVLKENLTRLAPAVREALQVEQDHRARLAAENALRESEIRFRALTENSSDIIFVIAPDGVVLFDSPSIKHLLGYEPGELLGRSAFDLVHPDDVERSRKALAVLVKKPGVLEVVEHRLQRKDERWRIFESRCVYLPETAGIHGVVINARDITDRIQAGLAMRRSERRYRRLFETAKDGILILHPATGDIIDANPFVIDMLGYAHEELLQKKFWDIVAFGDVESCKNAFVDLRTQGQIRYETLPLKTKAGKLLDVEFICNIYSENHRRVAQCNIRDLTERKRMERIGLESEIAARMAEGACLIRVEDKRIVYTNRRFDRLYGYAERELIGRNAAELIVERDAPERRLAEIEEALAQHEVWEGDLHHRRKNGSEFWCHATISSFEHPEHGRVWLSVCMDITERRETERMKEELIATVTHELRTPLTTMLGFVERLRGQEYSADTRHEYLDMIDKEGRRLSKLVNDFLDIQLIEAGRQEYHFQTLDLRPKLEEIRSTFAKAGTQHSFELLADPSLPHVRVDPTRIHQVLENLLSNAVKFTPQGGRIVIGARPVHEGIEVWVGDPGVGISAEDLPRVFDKFFRVSHPMMQVEPGTGLGLSLVKSIVEAHGGRAWAESEVGHGSTFYFTLPVVE